MGGQNQAAKIIQLWCLKKQVCDLIREELIKLIIIINLKKPL